MLIGSQLKGWDALGYSLPTSMDFTIDLFGEPREWDFNFSR